MIDLKKTYRTRNGNPVELYAIRHGNKRLGQVHGAVLSLGAWTMEEWSLEGAYSISEHGTDLVEVLPERRVWMNVYPEYHVYHNSLESAVRNRGPSFLRTVTVDLNTLETVYEKS